MSQIILPSVRGGNLNVPFINHHDIFTAPVSSTSLFDSAEMMLTSETLPVPSMDVVSWVFSHHSYAQDKPICFDASDPTKALTAGEIKRLVRKVSHGLRIAGLRHGDCVCLQMFNDIYFTVIFLGIIAAGGVFTGANPSYTVAELEHHFRTSNVKFFIAEPATVHSIRKAADACGIIDPKIWLFDEHIKDRSRSSNSWRDLLKHGEADWLSFNDERTAENTTATLLFSSGTTGLPKAVMLSHRNLIAQHVMFLGRNKRTYDVSQLLFTPQYHVGSLPFSHLAMLKEGFKTFHLRRFDLELYLRSIKQYQITDVLIVPAALQQIVKSPLSRKSIFRTIRNVLTSGSPVAFSTQEAFRTYLPSNTPVTQIYGMTEMTGYCCALMWPEDDHTNSVGNLLPNLSVRLIDDRGKAITDYNTPGEFCIKGPSITRGYFRNPEATETSFDADGFFRTGDICRYDEKTKKWYIVGRRKELIKVRAFQVAPAELESVLLEHPDIAEAVVIGVSDEQNGSELPRAYVVLRQSSEEMLSEEDVQNLIASRLASYKKLSGGVRFVDMIPRTITGKPLRAVLAKQALLEMHKLAKL